MVTQLQEHLLATLSLLLDRGLVGRPSAVQEMSRNWLLEPLESLLDQVLMMDPAPEHAALPQLDHPGDGLVPGSIFSASVCSALHFRLKTKRQLES